MGKKKHEWTRKGVTASMAVVMAFGMVPAMPTVALAGEEIGGYVAEEGQSKASRDAEVTYYVNPATSGDSSTTNTFISLENAVNAANQNDASGTVRIVLKGDVSLSSGIELTRHDITISSDPSGGEKYEITYEGTPNTHLVNISGAGCALENVTISVNRDEEASPNGNHVVNVSGDNVCVENVDIAGGAGHGLQFYKAENATIENVCLSDNLKTGLTINASTVLAKGEISLGDNGWGDGINVGWGSSIDDVITCSFDASEADLIGVDSIYVDKSDLTNAGNDYSKFEIKPSNGYYFVNDPDNYKEDKYSVALPESNTIELVHSQVTGPKTWAYFFDFAEAVDQAVNQAEARDIVVLHKDVTLSKKIEIEKSLTIDGRDNTITGVPNDKSVYFEIVSGDVSFDNLNLNNFGNEVSGNSGDAVIKVLDNDSLKSFTASNVDISGFARSAYDIRSGSFAITGGSITCANSVNAGNNSKLLKGVLAGLGSNETTGEIYNTKISGAVSNYEDWNTAAIEVYSNADVEIEKVDIDSAATGIHVDNYYGQAGQNVTVKIVDADIDAEDDAIKLYNTHENQGGVGNAEVTVVSGNYSGDVRIVGASDRSKISIQSGVFREISDIEQFKSYVSADSQIVESPVGTWTVAEKTTVNPGGGTGGGSTAPSEPEDVTTDKNPDGSTTTTVTEEDGSSTLTTVSQDGYVTTVVEKDAEGNVAAVAAAVSQEAVDAAEGGAVPLPLAEPIVPAPSDKAPEIAVAAPAGARVAVPVACAEGSDGPAPGAVLVLVAEDGERALPKTGSLEGALAAEVPEGCTLKVVDLSADFPDVSEGDWFAGVADFASARGILTGVVLPDGTAEFQGGLGTTRAMFVTMLNRMELEPAATDEAPSFGDVSEGDWYAGTAAWAAEEGLLSGYSQPDGTALFGGDDPVTREQAAVFLMRYAEWLGLDTSARAESAAPDASEVSGWAAEAVSWATAEGYILGDEGTGAVRPSDGATRAEAAAIVMRFVNSLY